MSAEIKSSAEVKSSAATKARQLTPARISLGLTGPSIPTGEQLRFQLDHALARDAVHAQLDVAALQRGLAERGLANLTLQSAVDSASGKQNRRTYLLRPDLGRKLHETSREALQSHTAASLEQPDVVFIFADGLSALAVERNALPLLDATLALLGDALVLAPVVIATQARVAIGDEIGEILRAKLSVLFIGERPGLSSPDSLGVYLTWNPRVGRTDAERNCISNIRAEGLSYTAAAERTAYYILESRRLQMSGIALKDPDPAPESHRLNAAAE